MEPRPCARPQAELSSLSDSERQALDIGYCSKIATGLYNDDDSQDKPTDFRSWTTADANGDTIHGFGFRARRHL